MARLDEIAEGVATLLASLPEPEPLPMALQDHTPSQIAFLVRCVIAACDRIGRPLAYVRVASCMASIISNDPDGAAGPSVVPAMVQPGAVRFDLILRDSKG